MRNPGGEIMEEESLMRNHGGGIMHWRREHGGGIMEGESWRRNHGGGIMEKESCRRDHGGGIMEEESWRRIIYAQQDMGRGGGGGRLRGERPG